MKNTVGTGRKWSELLEMLNAQAKPAAGKKPQEEMSAARKLEQARQEEHKTIYLQGLEEGKKKAEQKHAEEKQALFQLFKGMKNRLETAVNGRLNNMEKQGLELALTLCRKIISLEISERNRDYLQASFEKFVSRCENETVDIFVSPQDYATAAEIIGNGKWNVRPDNSLKKGDFYFKDEERCFLFDKEEILAGLEKKINND